MRRILLAAALLGAALLGTAPALAQGNTTGLVVATCGTPPSAFVEGRPGPFTVDVNGYLCVPSTLAPGGATAANQLTEIAKLDAIIAQAISAGTAGTPSAQVLSIQGVAGGTGVPLGAAEAHIGEVGGNQITVTVAQTVTASSAYSAGNAVGGLITIAGAARVSGASGAAGTSGLLQSVVVNAKSAQTTQMDLIVFSANPTGSTCTDKTAIAVAAADFDKVLGVAHVTDWTNLGTPSVGQAQNLSIPYALASSTTLYGCLVTRGTPTFAATSDISVSTRFLRN